MGTNRRQHYVPQSYMKQFANKDKCLAVCNLKTLQIYDTVSYAQQCYEIYYYGKDLIWESKLADMETQWGNIFNFFANSSSYFPSLEDEVLLKQFAIYQRFRTYSNNDYIKEQMWRLAQEALKMKIDNNGIPELRHFNKDYLHSLSNRIKDGFIKDKMQDVPLRSLEMAIDIQMHIADLRLKVIEYETQSELIISDNPIIIINPYMPPCIGLSMAGIVVFFPVTPRKLVVLYDSKMYNNISEDKLIKLNNENEVKNLNVHQLINANKIILSRSVASFENLIDNAEYLKIRKENKSRNIVDVFGTQTQKLVLSKPPLCLYTCTLSFCKLPASIIKIPSFARDSFPRKYDKDWENRFENKPKIIKITNQYKNKQLRGFKQMNDYIFRYWGIK